MRHALFAAAAAAVVASAPARAANPVDTYKANLSVLALDDQGKVMTLTPGTVPATSGWELIYNQTLNGKKTNSISYCGIATNGVAGTLTAGALVNVVCGDGTAPVATWNSNGSFAAEFTATCSYQTGAWSSLYYSPSDDVVSMPKQSSVCNGSGNVAEKFSTKGSAADYGIFEVQNTVLGSQYVAGVVVTGTHSVSYSFPTTLFDAAKQVPRPDLKALMNAQRLVNFNNQHAATNK